MTDSASLGVVTTDRGLVIRGWNDWLALATGVDESGVVGRPLIDFVAASRADFYRDLLTDVIENRTPRVLSPAFHRYFIECAPRLPSRHFSHMQQSVTVAPLCSDAEVVGVLITLEDVTERLDQEKALSEELSQPEPQVEREEVAATFASDDWRLRRKAVGLLKQTASISEVRYLLDTLQREHHDLNVLNSALRVLIATGRAVVAPLTALLSDPVPNLRMHAALGLGELRSLEAVPALVGALDDADDNVRFHAIEALGRIGSSDAVDPLARIAGSGNFFLAFAAIDALSKTDDARVAPLVQSLLDDASLRPAAMMTLASIGDEESVAALCAIINTGADAATAAAALTAIHARYEDTFGAGNVIVDAASAALTAGGLQALVEAAAGGADRRAAAMVLTWLGQRALPALVALVGDQELESVLEPAIAAIGEPAVDLLLPRLYDAQPAVRVATATLLGRLADGRATGALVDALDDADASVVAAAATAMAMLGDPTTLDALFGLFAHPSGAVRRAAVAGVNSIGASGTAARVKQSLQSPSAEERESALKVAGYFAFADCGAAIKAALTDAHEQVRRAAIEQLPLLDDAGAVTNLIEAVQQETPRNRAVAAHALRLADDRRAGPALAGALGDGDSWVRYFAALAIGESRHGRGATEALASVARNDPAIPVRIAAITSLASLDANLAAVIAAQSVSHPDDDLAVAAVTAIGPVNGKTAADALTQAAQSPRAAVQRAAIRAIGYRPSSESIEILAWAARLDEPAGLAQEAIDALCRIVSTVDQPLVRREAVEALLELAADDTHRERAIGCASRLPEAAIPDIASGLSSVRIALRVASIDALAAMRQPRASRELARALRDEDPTVRAAAVAAFAKLGTPSVGRMIGAMRTADPDEGVRHRAAQACRRHGWSGGPSRHA